MPKYYYSPYLARYRNCCKKCGTKLQPADDRKFHSTALRVTFGIFALLGIPTFFILLGNMFQGKIDYRELSHWIMTSIQVLVIFFTVFFFVRLIKYENTERGCKYCEKCDKYIPNN